MDDYVNAALRHAQFDHDSDGSAYGIVCLGTRSVESSGRTYAQCRASLWQMVRHEVDRALQAHLVLPPMDGVQPPSVSTN